ncbi:MAG: ABC transporter ATP-binding protein [Planctomycetes bacterium]|nr:ABC transporter ATP-binding protein [Planctomycetota bacterium]
MRETILDLKNIRLVRDGRRILRDVTWRIAPGEHWAMIGANGSGKTTLLRVASGTLWPTGGTVSVLGHPFGTVDLRELRRRIGWVSSALAETIHRNQSALAIVLSGLRASAALYDQPTAAQTDRAEALLADLGCGAVAASRFGVCSLGEQQKILIARAMMADPELLILDEACAGLDLPAREHLLATIDALAARGGMTLVFVTHHIEEITSAFSHALLLDDGAVAAQGPTETVLAGEVLSSVLKIPIRIDRHDGRYWPRIGAAAPTDSKSEARNTKQRPNG